MSVEVYDASSDARPFWNAVVQFCGVAYFIAWSYSFYPQLILNYKRKSTTGVSPDFIHLNPLGFLALTIWSWGAYFSPVARRQYQARHDGHLPQVSASDLAFSLHAFLISFITLLQAWWYARRSNETYIEHGIGETTRLVDPDEGQDPSAEVRNKLEFASSSPTVKPSIPCQLALVALVLAGLISASMVWAGKTELLDWLYLMSSIKLIISIIKFVPQAFLNYRLRSVEGFAIGQIISDLIGSAFSFAQLVISSTLIDGDAGGIIANPVKLGLSIFSVAFDTLFIVQKYWFFRRNKEEAEGGAGDEED